METLAQHACFGGTLGYYRHAAVATQCAMRFTVFVPPKPTGAAVVFLSGLTCTEENFTVKAGAYRVAATLGLTIIAPDTSPRGDEVPDDESISLGKGAGFYLDATQAPWSTHYRMYSYIAHELPALVETHFGVTRFGLCGHSMGGLGALTIGMKHPQRFTSLSALAPVCTPSQSGWGPAALTAYLGADKADWVPYDPTELMRSYRGTKLPPILIDQGLADSAYREGRLNPEAFVEACAQAGQQVEYRTHAGYDHGYFFIQTFIEDHLRHHAQRLA
ncbi:MAG: S-formylglutathione hydrolase [Pseudomonadota bacterium]